LLIEPTDSIHNGFEKRPVGGQALATRQSQGGAFASAKQQTPTASDLDAALCLDFRWRRKKHSLCNRECTWLGVTALLAAREWNGKPWIARHRPPAETAVRPPGKRWRRHLPAPNWERAREPWCGVSFREAFSLANV